MNNNLVTSNKKNDNNRTINTNSTNTKLLYEKMKKKHIVNI